jgi:2'-5' RNA ligase
MPTVRSFIAVNLNEEVRASLAKVEEQLRKAGGNVRWVPPPNFHLTLLFLGNVEQDKLAAMAEALRTALDGSKPFDIEFVGIGGLPRPDRPRVLCVDVKDEAGNLAKLNEKISAAMASFGVKQEDRRYIPHMTLGRVVTPTNLAAVVEASRKYAGQRFGRLTVKSVELMLSDLRPTGPVYSVAATIALV